jgi:steroid delta-isomerase-like uncharacterized protein
VSVEVLSAAVVDRGGTWIGVPGRDLHIPQRHARLEYYFTAFPELHYEIEDLVASGDKVVARVVMTGTHEGDYDGAAGSGKTFVVDEVDIFDVVDGRISGYRIVWDELGFRRQLGLPLA